MDSYSSDEPLTLETHAELGLQRVPIRILLVSPYFAPSTEVGAKRFSFLARKFERLGYQIDTLTTELTQDDRVDASIPMAGRVHRTRSVLPNTMAGDSVFAKIYNRLIRRVIGIPDRFIGWLPCAVIAGRRVTKNVWPDVIIATGPPFTAFLVGAILRRVLGVQLVLDYRDPWCAFSRVKTAKKPRVTQWLNRRLEHFAVSSASALVFASETMRNRFTELFVGNRTNLLKVLTNGFDEPIELQPLTLTPDAVNILYAGNFYGERRLSVLVGAVKELMTRIPTLGRQFAIHVFGKLRDDDQLRVEESGWQHLVHMHEPVDHNSVLAYMRAADILYLPSGNDVKYALPYKLFDYMSVRRPILAVCSDDSALAEFLDEFECGEIVNTIDPSNIADAIAKIMVSHEAYTYAGVEQFTWNAIAIRYGDLLKQLTKTRHE